MEVTCLNLVLVNIYIIKEVAVRKVVKELKISVEQGRVVTTLNITNTLNILFSVA